MGRPRSRPTVRRPTSPGPARPGRTSPPGHRSSCKPRRREPCCGYARISGAWRARCRLARSPPPSAGTSATEPRRSGFAATHRYARPGATGSPSATETRGRPAGSFSIAFASASCRRGISSAPICRPPYIAMPRMGCGSRCGSVPARCSSGGSCRDCGGRGIRSADQLSVATRSAGAAPGDGPYLSYVTARLSTHHSATRSRRRRGHTPVVCGPSFCPATRVPTWAAAPCR